MAKPLKSGPAPSLSECAGVTVASSRIPTTPSSTLSAIRMPGMRPWRISICAQARRRAAFTAAVTPDAVRWPPAAISSSARQQVATDATGPNSCPRSWISTRGEASAFDSPAVSPVLSARCRSSATPACDTMP